ncbi:Uncharacterised protein [Gordonia paraffinivorans]|uniref:Uncharacterized protein n=2 Tax=Gordonia paraffinivorans TaxID=175628 RepID=A0ABD7V7L4_9ACTN|nr:Uncharacterised protein [Gordonia paraffinivorans]
MLFRGCFVVSLVCVGLAALVCGAGVGSAAPTPLATKYDSLVTDDGWKIELRASELVVNPMSNIANSFASREGWMSEPSWVWWRP